MNVAIELPEDVSAELEHRWGDVQRRVLEATAAEAYRSGVLTGQQIGRLLGHHSRWETEAFLKRLQVWLQLSPEDVERDVDAVNAARA